MNLCNCARLEYEKSLQLLAVGDCSDQPVRMASVDPEIQNLADAGVGVQGGALNWSSDSSGAMGVNITRGRN